MWKYQMPDPGDGPTKIMMPATATILHIHKQRDRLFAWAVCDDDAKFMKERTFVVLATGEEIPPRAHYLGTAHFEHAGSLGGGSHHVYVWHVFEVVGA